MSKTETNPERPKSAEIYNFGQDIPLNHGTGHEREPPDTGSTAASAADVTQGTNEKAAPRKKRRDNGGPDFLLDSNDRLIPNVANVRLLLSETPAFAGLVKYDQMNGVVVLHRSLPGSGGPPVVRPLTGDDIGHIQVEIQRKCIPRVGLETVQQAINMEARSNSYHPVQDYLAALRWDRKPRLDGWLHRYMSAEKCEYSSKVGRYFFLMLVARILNPGCKADYVIVWEGTQGIGKSKAARIIAREYFSDNLPDLTHSDPVRLSMHLRGKWLIEIAELSSFGKAETAALKAFITSTEERYLPKYERNEVIEKRQVVFVGTTNNSAYLRDETGGRRFWPVKVGLIDTEGLAQDRDQLFAEAFVAFKNGETWWPDASFEALHIAPRQEARYETDPWEPLIAKHLAGKNYCTTHEIALEALGFQTSRLGTAEQRRICAVLGRLGWIAKRDQNHRFWKRSP